MKGRLVVGSLIFFIVLAAALSFGKRHHDRNVQRAAFLATIARYDRVQSSIDTNSRANKSANAQMIRSIKDAETVSHNRAEASINGTATNATALAQADREEKDVLRALEEESSIREGCAKFSSIMSDLLGEDAVAAYQSRLQAYDSTQLEFLLPWSRAARDIVVNERLQQRGTESSTSQDSIESSYKASEFAGAKLRATGDALSLEASKLRARLTELRKQALAELAST